MANKIASQQQQTASTFEACTPPAEEAVNFTARPRLGEYYADYSELTLEEIAADDPDCTELFENSKPSSR